MITNINISRAVFKDYQILYSFILEWSLWIALKLFTSSSTSIHNVVIKIIDHFISYHFNMIFVNFTYFDSYFVESLRVAFVLGGVWGGGAGICV